MEFVAIDTETHLIEPGNLRPRLVSVAAAASGLTRLLHREDRGLGLLLRLWLKRNDVAIVGHNLAFDLEVLREWRPELGPLIFEKLDRGLAWDTQVVEKLIHIARGTFHATRYSLADLAERYLGENLAKGEDTWRLRYAELGETPVDSWPAAARWYAMRDAEVTMRIAKRQAEEIKKEIAVGDVVPGVGKIQWGKRPTVEPDEIKRQIRASYALHLMACEGVRADPATVAKLRLRTETRIAEHEQELEAAGVLTRKACGAYKKETKVIKELVEKAYEGRPVPKTAKGNVQTSREVLLESGDPTLAKLASRGEPLKVLDFVKILEKANPLCPRWNVLVASGRTSCGAKDEPGNLQNQPRKGGVRECFVPRPGYVYVAADYSTAELRALAQVHLWWFGRSEMAKAFLEGRDLHQELADNLHWLDRQGAKVANFGLPGGLGARSLIAYAKTSFGIQLTPEQAEEVRQAFLERWPEMSAYFKAVSQMTPESGGAIVQPWSKRVRGDVRFTSAANSFFQGLVADGAKLALWSVARECYDDVSSALFGCRPVAFIHDEILIEAPRATAHLAAERLERVMVEQMQRVLPDVPVEVTAHIMGRWYKGAEAVRDESGKLIEWKPSNSQ